MSLLSTVRRTFTLFAGLLVVFPAYAMNPASGTYTCSEEDYPTANINDIHFSGTGVNNVDYLEVYIIENDVDVTGWQLCTQDKANGQANGVNCYPFGAGNFNNYYYGNPQGDDSTQTTFNTGTYLWHDLAGGDQLNGTYGELLLLNENDQVVDFIRYCDGTSCPNEYWNVSDFAKCGFELIGHEPGNKDIARLPDGTGTFQDNDDNVTLGNTNDPGTLPTGLFFFNFDEALWNGTPAEVIDSNGNASGQAINGAFTSSDDPAIRDSPGTCGYGDFGDSNSNGYVSVSVLPSGGGGGGGDEDDDENEIEVQDSLSLGAWIRTEQDPITSTQTIFNFGDATTYLRLSVSSGGALTVSSSGLFASGGNFSTASGTVDTNNWYYVVLVVDPFNDNINIYLGTEAGSMSLISSQSYTLPGGGGDDEEFELEIENAGDFTIGGGSGLPAFNGLIDEVSLYPGALGLSTVVLNQGEVNETTTTTLDLLKDNSRPCPVSLTHYAITGNTTGISCLANQVTVTAHNSNDPHTAENVPADTTLNLSSLVGATGIGTWTSVLAGSGTGAFTATAGNNGTASYVWPGGESSVTFLFNYTTFTGPSIDSETVAINVSDENGLTEDETEDLAITFSRAGFIFDTIPTQISGKPSDTGFNATTLNIHAVRASDENPGVCVAAFPDNTTIDVELGAKCTDPSTCAGNEVSINGTAVDTTDAAAADSFDPVSLTFNVVTNGGVTTNFASYVLSYPDAGELELNAQYDIPLANGSLSGNYMIGTSNPFVVRPFALTVTNIINAGPDGTYDTADDISNPAGSASSGDGFIAAQDTFAATVSSIQWQTGEDDDNNGVPDSDADLSDNALTNNFNAPFTLTPTDPSPAGGTTGSLLGSTNIDFTTVGNDQITVTDLTYNEAGGITLLAEVLNYLGASDADITGSALVGRFYPDYFSLDSNSVTAANGNFTYMGQDGLLLSYTLTARGSGGSILTNYDDTLGYADTANISTSAENNNEGSPTNILDNRISDPVGSWVAGSYTVINSSETFSRLAAGPDGPYQQLQIGISIDSEADGRNIQNLDQKTDQNNDCVADTNCTSRTIGSTTDVRYGRLRVNNAFGSELVDLPIQLIAEYFVTDGTEGGFVLNPDDSSTSYSATDTGGTTDAEPVSLSNFIGNLGAADTSASGSGTLSGGYADPANPIILAAPGDGDDGSVDVTLDVPLYLEYDWDGDGLFDNDPTGTATFGIFSGNDSTIYLRELY